MVTNYTDLYSPETIFGKHHKASDLVSIGTLQQQSDSEFKMTVANLEQRFCLVPDKVKEAHLVYFLNQVKLKGNQQVIIFTSTCRNCHFIAMLL